MKRIIKLLIIICALLVTTNAYAASISANASKTSCYVGDNVTVNVSINAGTWNVHINGDISATIVCFDMDGNVTTNKSYKIDTSTVGTRTITITGDITDYETDVNSPVNKTITVTVNPAPVTQAPQTTTRRVTTTAKSVQSTTVHAASTEVETTTIPETTTQAEYDILLSIVGYEIPFDKNTYEYTIKVDNNVTQLYVLVEGEDIVKNSGIIDIKDKDKFQVTVMHGEEEINYTFNIDRNNNDCESEITMLKNSNKGLKVAVIVSCALTVFISAFMIIMAIANKGRII